jgi:hypothetical protein
MAKSSIYIPVSLTTACDICEVEFKPNDRRPKDPDDPPELSEDASPEYADDCDDADRKDFVQFKGSFASYASMNARPWSVSRAPEARICFWIEVEPAKISLGFFIYPNQYKMPKLLHPFSQQ